MKKFIYLIIFVSFTNLSAASYPSYVQKIRTILKEGKVIVTDNADAIESYRFFNKTFKDFIKSRRIDINIKLLKSTQAENAYDKILWMISKRLPLEGVIEEETLLKNIALYLKNLSLNEIRFVSDEFVKQFIDTDDYEMMTLTLKKIFGESAFSKRKLKEISVKSLASNPEIEKGSIWICDQQAYISFINNLMLESKNYFLKLADYNALHVLWDSDYKLHTEAFNKLLSSKKLVTHVKNNSEFTKFLYTVAENLDPRKVDYFINPKYKYLVHSNEKTIMYLLLFVKKVRIEICEYSDAFLSNMAAIMVSTNTKLTKKFLKGLERIDLHTIEQMEKNFGIIDPNALLFIKQSPDVSSMMSNKFYKFNQMLADDNFFITYNNLVSIKDSKGDIETYEKGFNIIMDHITKDKENLEDLIKKLKYLIQ